MVFTSPFFVFVFLPLVWLVWYGLRAFDAGTRGSLLLLCVASLVFYAWWHVPDLALLAASIGANFLLGRLIANARPASRARVAAAGVAANLAVLAVFKYWALFTGWRSGLALPLAISFFTFTQIAFLVDSARDKVREPSLLRYSAFVLFFPHLIAGPIVRLQEIQDQLTRCVPQSVRARRLARGFALVAIGLAKKIFIADSLAPAANILFGSSAETSISASMAFVGLISFYFQIYFDFSGYTDIALGTARLFGIRFPRNFNHPYRAASLVEFWKRWHMTLSRFLRDYLYIPLGGNRKGLAREIAALLVTMGLGGLWHGAALTFVAWGLVHGVGLAANHLARRFLRLRLPTLAAWALTQLFVLLAWVLFRSPDMETALRIYAALAGATQASGAGVAAMASASFAAWSHLLPAPLAAHATIWLGALLAVAAWAAIHPRLPVRAIGGHVRRAVWTREALYASLVIVLGAALVLKIRAADAIEPFIYFQF